MDEFVCVVTPNLTFRPVDVIVRCRDCVHYVDGECALLNFSDCGMDDGFCAWGEGRDA